jgi:amino acid permease
MSAVYNPLSIDDKVEYESCNASGDTPIESEIAPLNMETFRYSSSNSSSLYACYVCMLNTVLGGGFLGLPYVLSQTGWVLGILLLICCALSSLFSLHELSVCARISPMPATYYSIGSMASPNFVWFIDFAVLIKCFGTATSYLIIFADLLPEAAMSFGVNSNRTIWLLIAFLFIAPFSFLKEFGAIKYTSTIFVFVIWILLLLSAGFVLNEYAALAIFPSPCSSDGSMCHGSYSVWTDSATNFLRVLPIAVFGFTCHQVSTPVSMNANINIFILCVECVYCSQ